jgi:hypothetical protein
LLQICEKTTKAWQRNCEESSDEGSKWERGKKVLFCKNLKTQEFFQKLGSKDNQSPYYFRAS